MAVVDSSKWRYLASIRPVIEWQPLLTSGNPTISTGTETFLVVFRQLSLIPDYLLRSKLVIRPLYFVGGEFSAIEARDVWIKVTREPREFTIEFPRALLIDGSIFRSFQVRRYNRYISNINRDGDWEIDLYESRQPADLQELPDLPPPRPPETEWEWRY